MRRLARHLFTLCSAVSLLLCVAVCVLWVRSHRWRDDVFVRIGVRPTPTPSGQVAYFGMRSCLFGSSRGILYGNVHVIINNGSGLWSPLPGPPEWKSDRQPAQYAPLSGSWLARHGFAFEYEPLHAVGPQQTSLLHLTTPHWFAALLLSVLPAADLSRRARRWQRRHPDSPHICPTCRYDLRASPDRCPECGAHPVEADA